MRKLINALVLRRVQSRQLILPTAFCILAACVHTDEEEIFASAETRVVVTELDVATWQVEYYFAQPESALIFSRSRGDYRTASWEPLGDAPKVRRVAEFDAIIFEEPTNTITYKITPHSEGIAQDYTPFLKFRDGGRAVFTGQFEVLPVAASAEIESLEGDLNNWAGNQPLTSVRVQADRPLLFQGEPRLDSVEHRSIGAGTYVYVGDQELVEGQSYIGVIDSGLPGHLREMLDEDLSALFEIYDQRWGFSLPTRLTIYYAFEGFDHPGYSNKGSVLGTDLMVLQSSGNALREPTPEVRIRNLWFFAHEAAHMYQADLMGRFNVGPDSWIHEGGANAMAYAAIQSLPGVPAGFVLEEYRTAFEECVSDLEKGSLVSAHLDGRHLAHYHCGQLFNAAADSALSDLDLYGFWIAFTENLDTPTKEISETFFATLDDLGADPQVSESIRELASYTSNDPRTDLIDLLLVSGMKPEFDQTGQMVGIRVPK